MALSIYLDDSLDDDELIARLRMAGYDVVSPRQVGTSGWDDHEHLTYASERGYVILTADAKGFSALHELWQKSGRAHAGILVVYRERDVSKNMAKPEIVRAIGNLLGSGVPVVGELHCLNHWR
ncbi:MAG: DUF5615 family PIN-like protein [Armatimonadota bacterium]|nr:DUF5615 family PIN-like protein [Armatimonadota bacterium]